MSHSLDRPWDSYDAYLFDIDGTLLQCTDAVHYFAFCDTLTKLAGRDLNLDGVTAHGNTDIGIIRDALSRAGVPDPAWRPRLAEIRHSMCSFVRANKAGLCTAVMPQVRELLEHLHGKGAILGVATGNLGEIGRMKLESAGLLQYFRVNGWSDEHEYRADVFRAAVENMRSAAGVESSICVVGDTPADIHAAHANHVPVIAVATGIYPFECLQAECPNLCLHSFADILPSS